MSSLSLRLRKTAIISPKSFGWMVGAPMFMLISACSSDKPAINKLIIEAEIGRCGLLFSNPKWKLAMDGRHSLSLFVPKLDSVTKNVIECVTNVAIKYDVAAALNAAEEPPQ